MTGPKGRGKRGKSQPGGLSGKAGSAPSLLARKGERNPLQGFRATIERPVSNPATSTPGSVDFLTLPGFRFWRICRFFSKSNLSGCSRAAMHCLAASKTRLPGISVYFRFFPWRKCPIYTSKATVPDNSDSRQSARYKFRCRSRTLGW